jgi:hypothetical protein
MVLAGPYDPTQFTSLDGTWAHYASDRWDGSGIGEGSPGGVSSINGYLRIQDTGDPADFGVPDATSNRKLYFVHDIGPDGASDNILDEGVTLFFRMRLATDGLLDQLRPNGGGDLADVPTTGDGHLIHDSGKGNIGIKQAARGIISFSLITAEENDGEGGLIMNSLNGSALSSGVDTGEGTANIIPLDPTVWHNFWVTIQADTSGVGTHQVDVSVDGGSAQTFLVTAGNANDYDGTGFIAIGAGSSSPGCAFDLASLQFAPGVIIKTSPLNGASDVERDATLNWVQSASATAYNVYFGTSSDEVQNADINSSLLVGPGHDANSYDPGQLEYGLTYYWRVDEIGTPASNVQKGKVWSFTVEPFARAISADDIIATASSQAEGQGPENTINESGLVDDLHSTDTFDMWATVDGEALPAWIQYEFDKTYQLNEMQVWNYNGQTLLSAVGIMDVVVEYSTDGVTWSSNDSVSIFNKASGAEDYAYNTSIPFNGIPVKYVKVTTNSNWSGGFVNQCGLSEVRFLYIPVNARTPVPDDGATDVAIDVTLGWKAGREADEHNVYISTDEQAVTEGTVAPVTVAETSYGPLSLDLGTTYYWRVDEVNNANATPIWEGNTWSFTTSDYRVVDDFESYNDIPAGLEGSNLIYLTWVDGYDNPSTNGSTMGYSSGASLETAIARSGYSAPLMYNNTTAGISKVTANTQDLPGGSDWTIGSPEQLVLWIYGDQNNPASEQMYVEIDGVKKIFSGDIAAEQWQDFPIDLTSLGINLSNVGTVTIGLEKTGSTGGSGMIFIDDVQLN